MDIVVAKIDAIEGNLSFQPFVGNSAFCSVRMFPRPETCTLCALAKGAVWLFNRINQFDITVVSLWLFLQKVENTVSPCQSHDNAVKLLADLGDGLCKTFIQGKEGHQCPQSQAYAATQSQHRTHNSAQHIADIAQIRVDRHENIGELIGAVGALTETVIAFPEAFQAFFLMAENLDDLLTAHHLLNIAVHIAQIPLLRRKISA